VFPLIGGINTVKAQYLWNIENGAGYKGVFYTGSTPVTKVTENLTKSIILLPAAFNAAIGTDGRAAPYVTLKYTYAAANPPDPAIPSPELTGAITPEVYRAEVIGKTGNNNSQNTGTTISGWAALDIAATAWKKITTQADGEEINPLTYDWYAEDTTVEKGHRYTYILVLKTATQTTAPAVITLPNAIPDVLPKAPLLTVVNTAVVQNLDASGNSLNPPTYGIAVSWQGDATSTYKLYRAPNVGEDDTADGRKPGTWTPITVTKDALDQYSVFDNTGLTGRTSYFYKVVAVNDGIELTKTEFVTSGIYAKSPVALAGSITIEATVGNASPAGAGTTLTAGNVYFWLNTQQVAGSNLIAAAETIRVYYWQTSGGSQLATASFVEWTKAEAENATATSREKTASSIAKNRQYDYATYVKLADGTLKAVTGWTGNFTQN
jgi:hypothetical protein